jgi:tetratricopeptide (TPR) repeat protein
LENYFEEGIASCNSNKWETAINKFDLALKSDVTNPFYYNAKGFALFSENRFSEAKISFNRALDINPKITQFWNNLGTTLLEENQYEDAIECFLKSIKIDERNYLGFVRLSFSLLETNQIFEAVDYFDTAYNIESENTWNLLAFSNNLCEKIDNVISDNVQFNAYYQYRSPKIKPEEAGLLLNKFLDYLDNFVSINPNEKVMWGIRTQILRSLGKKKESKFSNEKYLEFFSKKSSERKQQQIDMSNKFKYFTKYGEHATIKEAIPNK